MAKEKEMDGKKVKMVVLHSDTLEEVTQNEMAKVVRNEEWAKGLIDPGTYEFAVTIDACLLICDECGQYRAVPEGLFCWRFQDVDATSEGT